MKVDENERKGKWGGTRRPSPSGERLRRLHLCGQEAVEVVPSVEGARSPPREARGRRRRGARARHGRLEVAAGILGADAA
jgi:hypothetical protein